MKKWSTFSGSGNKCFVGVKSLQTYWMLKYSSTLLFFDTVGVWSRRAYASLKSPLNNVALSSVVSWDKLIWFISQRNRILGFGGGGPLGHPPTAHKHFWAHIHCTLYSTIEDKRWLLHVNLISGSPLTAWLVEISPTEPQYSRIRESDGGVRGWSTNLCPQLRPRKNSFPSLLLRGAKVCVDRYS